MFGFFSEDIPKFTRKAEFFKMYPVSAGMVASVAFELGFVRY